MKCCSQGWSDACSRLVTSDSPLRQETVYCCPAAYGWYITRRLEVEYGSPGEVRLQPGHRPSRSTETSAAAQLRIATGEHRLFSPPLFSPTVC